MKTISATEANRHFSALLREVSRGAQITLTLRGKPIAVISKADQVEHRERLAARRALLSRLRVAPVLGTRSWSRDPLYSKAEN